MDDFTIKSSPTSSDASCKITDEECSKTKTNRDPKLAVASFILVDKYKFDEKTVDNPVLNCQNKIKTENSSPVKTFRSPVSPLDDKQGIVEGFKHSEMNGHSENLPLEATNDKVTKPARKQMTSNNQTGKVIVTRRRRVLVENQIPYSGQILRSGKKWGINPRASDTKKVKILYEHKSQSDEKRIKPLENCVGECSDGVKEESELLSPVDEKEDVIDVIKEEPVDEMLFKSKATMADVNQDEAVDKNAEGGMSIDSEKPAVPPTKKIRRRKCSEPLKSERVQTRRSITVTQDRNDFKYFSQHSRTRKDSPKSKARDKKSEEECNVVCNNCSDDHQNSNENKASIDKENNQALNLTNQKNVTERKTLPDLKSVVEKKNDSKGNGKVSQTSRKRRQENTADNLKQKAGHINVQAMPVYVNKTTVEKNGSQSQRKSIGLDSGIEVLASSETGEDEVEERSKTSRTEAETFFDSISLKSRTNRSTDQRDRNSDSEGTWSNEECVPNSPAHESLQNVTQKRVKPSNESNSGQKNSSKYFVTHRKPGIEDLNTELQRPSTKKQTKTDISCGRIDNSKPRFYVEASKREDSPDFNSRDDIANHSHSQRWLRHPERSPSNTKIWTGLGDQTKESSSSMIENSASDNLPIPLRKRGRPRKQDTEGIETNPQKKKKPSDNNGTDTVANGSKLTLRELDQLFSKWCQDGHFRTDPRQRPIIIYSNDLHQTFSSKIQCYNPSRYLPQHNNTQTRTNPDIRTPISSNFDCNGVSPSSNSPPALFERRMTTMNQNSQNFAMQSIDQTRYCGNYVSPGNNLNNNAQCGSFQQNCYQNSGNYLNSFPGMVTATNSMSTSNGNEFNYGLHTQQLNQNSIPYKDIDLTMKNEMNLSTNNSLTNNVMNNDWNEMNSLQGLWTDLNSINNANGNQTSDSVLPNLSNDQNSAMYGQNPWMNRPNGTTNPLYPMMQPWLGSFPMYNSYLNNADQYYNMFNPYSASMGLDAYSNNINARNGTGINESSWTQNANTGHGNSNFNSIFPQFSGINFDNNNMNQGMNLSLSNNRVSDHQNNSMELDDSIGQENSSLEQIGGNVSCVEPMNVESVQQSIRGHEYSLENMNSTSNLDFDEVDMPLEENQPQDKRLVSFDGCFQRFDSDETSSSGIVADLVNNRDTEMSKLRQELVDFTRQYSVEQISLTSEIFQGDDIFDCMMSQDPDTDESSTS